MMATITIPAPVAGLGDKVRVVNYRKNSDEAESGIVVARTWHPDDNHGAGEWSYRVELHRVDRHNKAMHLTVRRRIERI